MKFDRNNEELRVEMDLIGAALDASLQSSEAFNLYLSKQRNTPYSNSIKLETDRYSDNEFLKTVKLQNRKMGDVFVGQGSYRAKSSFLFDETYGDPDDHYVEVNPIGHFESDFHYPVIEKGQTPWMSVIPHEINSMKSAIDKAKGKVLTYGLGLGYFAFMASLKENVESVTIVEMDQKVINTFNSEILPFFPNKSKISIIKGDCFKFSEKENRLFDFLFIDVYHTPEDGLPFYVGLSKLADKVAKETEFWIEKSMVTYFRRYLIMAIEDLYNGNAKETDFEVLGEDPLDDLLAKAVISSSKTFIKSPNDLKEFLSDESIKKLLKNI